MFYRYLIKISLCHVVSKLSPLLRLILLWSVRRTVRYSSASTTAPPSSPIWFTWWSFTSLTEECCPASSNTHAPLWPCDTPPPQTFLCTPLSLRSPSLPFCPLYPFPYQRSGGWGDGEKLRPVLRMWTTLLGARTGSRCPPVGNVRLHLTAAWLFEWELLGQAKCRRLWTPAVVLLLVFRPQKKTSVMWNHKMATVCFQWVSWMDPFL